MYCCGYLIMSVFLFCFCVGLLHSLIKWLIASSSSLHSLHACCYVSGFLNSCCSAICLELLWSDPVVYTLSNHGHNSLVISSLVGLICCPLINFLLQYSSFAFFMVPCHQHRFLWSLLMSTMFLIISIFFYTYQSSSFFFSNLVLPTSDLRYSLQCIVNNWIDSFFTKSHSCVPGQESSSIFIPRIVRKLKANLDKVSVNQ